MQTSISTQSLKIFTDGAALSNPGPGGFGAVILSPTLHEVIELGGGKPHTTNNEMEMTAVLSALAYIAHTNLPVDLYTDSKFTINGATKWVYGWQSNNWTTKGGTPVMHRELWEDIIKHITARSATAKITWHHLPGHSGIVGNERADQIASAFAAGKPAKLFRGNLADYPIKDIATLPSDEEIEVMRAARAKRKSGSSSKAFAYVSFKDGVFMQHKTWDETAKRVIGQKGCKYQKVYSQAELDEVKLRWESGS